MKNRGVHKTIAFLLIAAFLMMFVNKMVFLHSHKLADGTIVVHAHPYKKTNEQAPFKAHHHISLEFVLLHHLELLFVLFFSFAWLFTTLAGWVMYKHNVVRATVGCIRLLFGRAPPIHS